MYVHTCTSTSTVLCTIPLDVSYMCSVLCAQPIKKHQIPKCSANYAWRNLFRLNYGVHKRVACSYKTRTISPAVRDTEPCRLIGYFLCRWRRIYICTYTGSSYTTHKSRTQVTHASHDDTGHYWQSLYIHISFVPLRLKQRLQSTLFRRTSDEELSPHLPYTRDPCNHQICV